MLQLKLSNARKMFVRSFENNKAAFLQINYLLCNPELKERDNKQVKIHKTSYEPLTMINNHQGALSQRRSECFRLSFCS